MRLSDFDFEIPENLIAKAPVHPRDKARLMVPDIEGPTLKGFKNDHFFNLADYLNEGDVLVLNNTKVFPSRIFGKTEEGKEIELFLLEEAQESACLVKPARRIKEKIEVFFSNRLSGLISRGVIPTEEGSPDSSIPRNDSFSVKFNLKGDELRQEIKKIGEMPIPPYILKERGNKHSTEEDKKEYQTVFAKEEGSVAAPTAGLHFTDELLEKIKAKGVIITEVTLHVGLGTFEPIREEEFIKHKMHSEKYSLSEEAGAILSLAKKQGRRIIACGTTVTRVLESRFQNNQFISGEGETDIFIYPGYQFEAIDALITNFHLPKSSLLLLVSAFIGIENTKKAYQEAIRKEYRFYSYGDGMILFGH